MDKVVEKTKPKNFTDAKPIASKIPEEIKTTLALMNLHAQCYSVIDRDSERKTSYRYWEITNDKTLKYVRIDAKTLGMNEDIWREVMGLLLDHGIENPK